MRYQKKMTEVKFFVKVESTNQTHLPSAVGVSSVVFFVLLLLRRRLCEKNSTTKFLTQNQNKNINENFRELLHDLNIHAKNND